MFVTPRQRSRVDSSLSSHVIYLFWFSLSSLIIPSWKRQDVASLYQIYPPVSGYEWRWNWHWTALPRAELLSWLGIDSIWISPSFVSPLTDFGYDIANYRLLIRFGKMHDFKRFLKKYDSTLDYDRPRSLPLRTNIRGSKVESSRDNLSVIIMSGVMER